MYGNGGEIPEAPRGSGFQTIDGFQTRTPFVYDTAVHADYGIKVTQSQRVVWWPTCSISSMRSGRSTTTRTLRRASRSLNPDLGQPSRFNLAQLQTPRQIRLGVRVEF